MIAPTGHALCLWQREIKRCASAPHEANRPCNPSLLWPQGGSTVTAVVSVCPSLQSVPSHPATALVYPHLPPIPCIASRSGANASPLTKKQIPAVKPPNGRRSFSRPTTKDLLLLHRGKPALPLAHRLWGAVVSLDRVSS